jgi:uncharacterized surface protein with fasciclin (FAS1) repeats
VPGARRAGAATSAADDRACVSRRHVARRRTPTGKNKALLKKVLLYHVVRGELKAGQVVKRHALETLEGANVKIKVTHAKEYVNKAQIVKANVFASNGVIHVINAVLIPPK